MPHDEHCGCGCGHDHAHSHQTGNPTVPIEATENQKDFLHQLAHRHYLPVARFSLKDSREDDFVATALAPVYISAIDDDMPTVKGAGTFLQSLEDMGLITLDYDIPINKYAYDVYKESALYAYFCETVAEGALNPSFLGDTPVLELGSISLTDAGEKIAAAHCGNGHHHHI